MLDYGLPIVTTLFVWWFSTGAILFLNGLHRATFRWSLAAATLVAAVAFYGLATGRHDQTPAGAYLAFGCALAIWGWIELGFLLGHITGSRRTECPQGAQGLQRFIYATQSILHHELLIVASVVAIAAVTWQGDNHFGLWTFVVLWLARLSTKLNIFLGVPNVTIEFLPTHLNYLKSFFRNRPMNLLFPLSVTVTTVVTVMLSFKALNAVPGSFEAVGYLLLSTLMALAVIEHWFLVIPLPVGELWSWGLGSRKPARRLAAGSPAAPKGRDEAAEKTNTEHAMDAKAPLPLLPGVAVGQPALAEGSQKPGQFATWPGHVSCAGATP